MIQDRLKPIVKPVLTDDRKMFQRVIEMGNTCSDLNIIFVGWANGKDTPQNLAKECINIGTIADSILYELYVSGEVTMEEIEQMMKDKIHNWNKR